MTNFNERTNTFFIRLYLSHFILKRADVGCVWEVSWRRGQTAVLTPSSSSTIAALHSHLAGLFNRGSLRAASPQSASWFSRWHPVYNWLEPSGTWLYDCLRTPASAVLLLIYTGASLDWRLGRGSIYNIRPFRAVMNGNKERNKTIITR